MDLRRIKMMLILAKADTSVYCFRRLKPTAMNLLIIVATKF